jgi:hypothetical protein
MRIIRDQDNSFRRIPGTCGYTVRVRHEKAFDSSSPYDAAIHGQDIVDRITDPCLSKNAWNLSRGLSASKGALFNQLQRDAVMRLWVFVAVDCRVRVAVGHAAVGCGG